jgi:YegS/Rv2252/BmrU family lipid kinase
LENKTEQFSIEVIINAGSGVDDKAEIIEQLTEIFAANNLNANFSIAKSGQEIETLAKNAAKGEAKIVVAGGGDGTINAVAAQLIETDKILGVLPLGTFNNFSKDLGIPQDLAEAVRVIADNNMIEIDVAEANDRIFINNSSLGLYPHIVRKREQQQERLGYSKWYALFWAALAIFRRYPFLDLKLKIENKYMERRTPFIFVGNNEYEMQVFNIGGRSSLQDGLLSVYVLHKTGRLGLLLLVFRMFFGSLREAEDFDEFLTDEVQIEKRQRKNKRVLVALDGEVTVMESPLRYRILPKALRVIAPRKENENE